VLPPSGSVVTVAVMVAMTWRTDVRPIRCLRLLRVNRTRTAIPSHYAIHN